MNHNVECEVNSCIITQKNMLTAQYIFNLNMLTAQYIVMSKKVSN